MRWVALTFPHPAPYAFGTLPRMNSTDDTHSGRPRSTTPLPPSSPERDHSLRIVFVLIIVALFLMVLWLFYSLTFCQEGRMSLVCYMHFGAFLALLAADGLLIWSSRPWRGRVAGIETTVNYVGRSTGWWMATATAGFLTLGWLLLVLFGPFDTF
jgi:hypothetical protein